jgi:secreted PhoX family phosphatase
MRKIILAVTLMIMSVAAHSETDISYGALKMHLEEGVSTQRDVINLFGSPDNMMMDSKGELWTYDRVTRTSTSIDDSANESRTVGGSIIILGGNKSDSNTRTQSTTSSSTKTITAILEFDKEGVLIKYSVRTSKY